MKKLMLVALLSIVNLVAQAQVEYVAKYHYDFVHLLDIMYHGVKYEAPLAKLINERAPINDPKLYDGLFESWYNTTTPSNLDELQMAFSFINQKEGIVLNSIDQTKDSNEYNSAYDYYEMIKSGMRADAISKYNFVFSADTLNEGGIIFHRDLDGTWSDKITIDQTVLKNNQTDKQNIEDIKKDDHLFDHNAG